MKLSNKTIQYSIYNRSEGKAKLITDSASVKRPSIENMTETIKGSGIMGEIDFPTLLQIAAMEYEISFKNASKEAIELFAQKTQHLEIRWATDYLDTSTSKVSLRANKDIIQGVPKKIDLGSIETNAGNEATLPLEILYFKHIQDGETLIEIDKLNNVFIINGVDYAAPLREAL